MKAVHPKHDSAEAHDIFTSSGSTGPKNLENRGCTSIIASQRETASIPAGGCNTAALRAADWLSLAAAPTFAIMALLVRANSERSPLNGMVLMYVLMAAFESVTWLKLISSRRTGLRKE